MGGLACIGLLWSRCGGAVGGLTWEGVTTNQCVSAAQSAVAAVVTAAVANAVVAASATADVTVTIAFSAAVVAMMMMIKQKLKARSRRKKRTNQFRYHHNLRSASCVFVPSLLSSSSQHRCYGHFDGGTRSC